MQFLDDHVLERAIEAMPQEFDTHDIVRHLYTKEQRAYLRELMANEDATYPFTETHRQIGKALLTIRRLIEKCPPNKVASTKTMRGKTTRIQKWRKLR